MLRVDSCVQCVDFPCRDVDHSAYYVPGIELEPEKISIVLISEAAPPNTGEGYYGSGSSLFQQTTLQAFRDAGEAAESIQELVERGVYFATAVKCAKTAYGIQTATIRACSNLLEQEISFFANVLVFLLMGDVAIKAINEISRRSGVGRVIPAGSTYKLRGAPYVFRGARVFPSYLQAGPSFYIEKSKRRMIAEDISAAISLSRARRG